MKLGQIAAAAPALAKLGEEKLSPKVLYKLDKLMRKIEGEIEFYNKQRDETVMKLGEHVKDAEYRIPAENRAEFEEKMRAIDNIDVEGEVSPVKISTSENIRLSYNDLRLLRGFFEFEDEDEDEKGTEKEE